MVTVYRHSVSGYTSITGGWMYFQRKHQNLTQSSSLYLEDKTPPGPYSNACRLLELTGERFRAASRYGKPMGNREKWLTGTCLLLD